ncbi:MAG TPA: hypothetical protein VKP58_01210 [Candidatus Acidoferrum sp.]|nr:hypothetical protein [Candidatus Acidoferrum sp.]
MAVSTEVGGFASGEAFVCKVRFRVATGVSCALSGDAITNVAASKKMAKRASMSSPGGNLKLS